MRIRAVIVRFLAVALVAVAALVASPAPAATPAEVKYANKIHERVNDIRANNDRARLKKNECLLRFAVKRAEYLAQHQDTSLPHTNLEKIQKACDVGWVGENLVYGGGTPNDLVRMWMSSPSHKSNILHKKFRITGVAARKGGGVWWVAQVFGKKL
jgi:uncharacterized protein YkwD